MKEEMLTIGQRLRNIRLEHNLKQEDLAKVLGVDRSAYSGYETGRSAVSVKNLCSLADIYKMTLSQLIGRNEAEEVTRIRFASVSSGIDPIAMLDRDEQLLLMYYRLASENQKKEIIEEIAKKSDSKEE